MMDPMAALAYRHPRYLHLLAIALMGKTADHLLDVHGITPAGDWRDRPEGKRENATAHLKAHRDLPEETGE